jgi:hypothetical protein
MKLLAGVGIVSALILFAAYSKDASIARRYPQDYLIAHASR